jgi:hypothetical protein
MKEDAAAEGTPDKPVMDENLMKLSFDFKQTSAVADVYDALMADRIYRKGLPEEEVLKILQHESGRKFDPDIVEVFLQDIDDIRASLQGHGEGTQFSLN